MYSKVTQNKVEKLCKRFCKNTKTEPVFTNDKLCQTCKYLYPRVLSSKVVYKFTLKSCNASYVGHYVGNYSSILDTSRTKHQLRIKESLFIRWLKSTSNK